MQKLNGKSMDIVNENIDKLKELFPEVFSEGKINFTRLEEELGEFTDTENEKYNFTWNGKQEAKKIAQSPSTGALLPSIKDSKDWNTTQNLYLEGDNLEVLKLIQKSYHKKIKMIYIDPPYNTGNDFVYKDNFKDNINNYLEQTGQIDSNGNRFSVNTDTSGRYHSNWLSMMYPRLKLAKNLLKEDGVIFISISEEEISNLKNVCNEIFGEDNFRNSFITRRHDKNINTQFAENGLKTLNVGFEYILCYSKSNKFLFNAVYKEASEIRKSLGYWKGFWNDADRPTMRYEILGFVPESGQWKWKTETAIEAVENYMEFKDKFEDSMTLEEYWISTNKTKKFIRRNVNGNGKNQGVEHWIPPSNGILRNTNLLDILATKNIEEIKDVFDFPKNVELIQVLCEMANLAKNDTVLDFFSGSATTAHAVMQLNVTHESNVKFILVQLPEKTHNPVFPTICDIGKNRIDKIGNKIKNNNQNLSNIDIGFKVFKLDSSNIKEWDSDFDNLETNLLDSVENIKADRTSEDLLYEILLKYGLDLTLPIEEKTINNRKVYVIGFGALIVCLDDEIEIDTVKKIAELKSIFVEEHGIETTRVVFKDSSFKNAVVKTNAIQILKQFGIDEVVSI